MKDTTDLTMTTQPTAQPTAQQRLEQLWAKLRPAVSRPELQSNCVVEFTRDTVSVLSNEGTRKRSFEAPSNCLDVTHRKSLVQWLRSATEYLQLPAAALCIPRSAGCLHVLEFPTLDSKAWNAAVDLEMEAVYGENVTEMEWDYLFLCPTASGSAIVQVFSIRRDYLATLRQITDQAGVKIAQLTPSDFCFHATLSTHAVDTERLHVIAPSTADQFDCLVIYKNQILAAQSLKWDAVGADFEVVAGTFRRLEASLPDHLQSLRTKKLAITDTDRHATKPAFSEQAQAAGYEVLEYAEAAFGQLPPSAPKQILDLAHPTQAPPAPLTAGSKAALAAAACVLLLAIFWGFNSLRANWIAETIRSHHLTLAAQDQELMELRPNFDGARQFEQWQDAGIRWDQLLGRLGKQFAPANDVYIVRMEMHNQNPSARAPVTTIEGRAKSTESVLELTKELAQANPGLSIHPNGIEPITIDPPYTTRFQIEISGTIAEVPPRQGGPVSDSLSMDAAGNGEDSGQDSERKTR